MAEPQKETDRKGIASIKPGNESVGTVEDQQQLMVTINVPTGRIVRIEKLDNTGKRQELVEEEWAKLVGEDEVEEIEGALEDAFEAGVAGVLGEEYEEDEAYEDEEEKALRRILIGGLVRRSIRRRILQRLVLSRLLRRGSNKTIKTRSLSTQKVG